MSFSRILLMGLLALTLGLWTTDSLSACPTCKDTLGLHALRVQMGYALSIGFMMLVPFGILGGWGIAIYRMCRVPGDVSQPSALPEADRVTDEDQEW